MPTFVRYVTLLTVLTLVLAGAFVATPAALPVAAAAALPVAPLLTADGALRTAGLAAGALDLTGWDVSLDPARGPLFRPATQASTPGWEHLGWQTGAAISSVVTSIVFDSNGNVYIGGTFRGAAGIPAADYLVMWNPATQQWSALGSDSALNGFVEALGIDGNGRLYVGGRFTNAAGIAEADYLVMWNPVTQQWSALGSNGSGDGALNGAVSDIYVAGTNIYIGGEFTNAAGIAAADYVARWDGTNWSALGSNGSGDGALNGAVNAIAAQGSNLYIGGNFTNAAGIAEADYIARWDGANWSALGSNGSGNGAVGSFVHTVLATADKVYVGGLFTNVAGLDAADYVAVWDGSNWSALGSNGSGDGALNAPVNKLARSGGNLYVGGNFTDAAGQAAADYLAVWDGSSWAALTNESVFNNLILEVAIDQSGNIYAGGYFNTVVGQPLAKYVAVWRGSSWAALGGGRSPALNDIVSALAVAPDGKVYVGGRFTNAGGNAAADYVAVWDPATETWGALGSDGALNDIVSALAVAPDGKVYVGGRFTNAGGNAAADYVAVWDPATETWGALGSDGALNDIVSALAVAPDGKVYVGGRFTNAGGNAAADYVAVWDPATETWGALGSNGALTDWVEALAVAPDGKVYVGGWFTNAGGNAAADRVAVWDPATQAWGALGSNGSGDGALNWGVYALVVAPDGKVYVGGGFTNAGGNAAADRVAVWDPATETWGALGSNGSGDGALTDWVEALAIAPDGKVYVGGWFTNAGEIAEADRVAVWDPATETWGALGSNGSGNGALNGSVSALAVVPDGNLYVGGSFINAGNNPLASCVASYRIVNVFRVFVPAITR